MSETKRNETLRGIFRAAINTDASGYDPQQYHPLDDDELLIEWSAGDLDEQRHRDVLDHLSECSYCRQELAAMIRAGALVLPDTSRTEDGIDDMSSNEKIPQQTVSLRRDRSKLSKQRSLLIAVVAVAASLLIAVMWWPDRGGDSALALARRDLAAGRNQAAMQRVEEYLADNKSLDAQDRVEAGGLLEKSAHRLASKEFDTGTPESLRTVLDIEASVARHEVKSGRIANLGMQARRGVNERCSMDKKKTLIAYKYDETGRHKNENEYIKSIFIEPKTPPTDKRIKREFLEAIKEHPCELDLRLNYGHFLMEQFDFTAAAEQFAAALKFDPKSVLAETGLGLALFQQETEESQNQALRHFRKAVDLAPADKSANLNLAVCLTRLGRNEEAKKYFLKADHIK